MTAPIFKLHQGSAPLLISMPHVGTILPEELKPRLVPRALAVEDTDWHLETLYSFGKDLGASMIVPQYSRYMIDLNRPPENTPMYPGSNNTELCPTHFFTGDDLYLPGQLPDDADIARRLASHWKPYHDALAAELARLKQLHGYVVLFDAHSINTVLPWLFEGQLHDLNLGSASGTSCDTSLRDALAARLVAQDHFSHVVDGRFKGGYVTRHYGNPKEGVHAVQLEMGYRCYMEEKAPYALDPARVEKLAPVLRSLLQQMVDWKPAA